MDKFVAARMCAITFQCFVPNNRGYAPNKQVLEQKQKVFVITKGFEDADTSSSRLSSNKKLKQASSEKLSRLYSVPMRLDPMI
jgi:hypothetical protein